MGYLDKLPGESGWKNASWKKQVIDRHDPNAMCGDFVPVIDDDPDTYEVPEGHHAVILGRNSVWLACNDGSRGWRGEQVAQLDEDAYGDRTLRGLISGLQTMRGERYMLFAEQSGIDELCGPEALAMFIALEGASPSSIFGVNDSLGDKWHIHTEIPDGTVLLVDETYPKLRTFDQVTASANTQA